MWDSPLYALSSLVNIEAALACGRTEYMFDRHMPKPLDSFAISIVLWDYSSPGDWETKKLSPFIEYFFGTSRRISLLFSEKGLEVIL